MEEFKIVFWYWWVVAVILAGLEMLVPGASLIWLAVAAGLTGVTVMVFSDMGWVGQAGLFALFSIAIVVAARMLPARPAAATDEPHLSRRADQYIGRTAVLESAIVNGTGKAKLGDSLWTVAGPDLPVGATVKITGAEGAVLRVTAA